MNLEDCLPPDLRGASTTITPLAGGLSGAGVYRVEADGRVFALKIWDPGAPLAGWRRALHVQRLAADAALAPRIVHVDEDRRAVLSDFVGGPPFPALYGDPRTRGEALARLGRTLRRVHALPVPPDAVEANPRELLASLWSGLPESFAVPPFVGDVVRRVLAEEAPPREEPPVLSHNDVNPGNLLVDGESLLLVDWEHAGLNDRFYDLAAISVFLNMDGESCRTLLSAYHGEPVSTIPARFVHNRRVMAALAGVAFLRLARDSGHPGAAGRETLDATLSLGEFFHQRMRTGGLGLATAEGQWGYGLALVKESAAY